MIKQECRHKRKKKEGGKINAAFFFLLHTTPSFMQILPNYFSQVSNGASTFRWAVNPWKPGFIRGYCQNHTYSTASGCCHNHIRSHYRWLRRFCEPDRCACLIYSVPVRRKSSFIVMTFLSGALNVNFADHAYFGRTAYF